MGARRPVSVALLIAALAFPGSSWALGQQDPADRTQNPGLLPQESEVVRLVNGFRESRGLRPLRVNALLCRAARKHAENMAGRGRMSHVLDGKDHIDRARAEGFTGPVSENVAAGSRDEPRDVLDLWLGSAAHRDNMLAAGASEIGVGFARSLAGGEDYWVAVFGSLP